MAASMEVCEVAKAESALLISFPVLNMTLLQHTVSSLILKTPAVALDWRRKPHNQHNEV